MNWVYKGNYFNEELKDNYFGFIYRLEYENEDGDIYSYYGRKNFKSVKNKTARLNGKPRDNHYRFFSKNKGGKRVKMEELRFESDWKTYEGSCKYIPDGLLLVHKEIIKLCDKEIDVTYWETYYLMVKEVLFDSMNLNMAIGRNYFAGRVSGSKKYLKEK